MTRFKAKPRIKRARNLHVPSCPGEYYWSEWKCKVFITRRGKTLYVTPPGGIEIKVTPFIAGKFTKL